MKDSMISYICHKLRVEDQSKIEIESKKKLTSESVEDLKKYLSKKKGVKHIRTSVFIDQFLDTPSFDVFHAGASLRLRYKGDGTIVYLQYKGYGFSYKNILFRSEFSSGKIKGLVKEESHHDIVHFTETDFMSIIEKHVSKDMRETMTRHLGLSIIKRIKTSPVICFYRREKYLVQMGKVAMEPSLDHLNAFHINNGSFHSLSNFWEYENEIKSKNKDLKSKLSKLDALLEFDENLAKKVDLYPEVMDKYHRILSCFIKSGIKTEPSLDENIKAFL